MNRFRSSKGVSLVRLDFWAPGDMRDWVDREACKAGLHRSEFLRRMIQHEMEAQSIGSLLEADSAIKLQRKACNHPLDR